MIAQIFLTGNHCWYVEYPAVVIDKNDAEIALRWLLNHDMLDSSRRIQRNSERVEIPVNSAPDSFPTPFSIKNQGHLVFRRCGFKPIDYIRRKASFFLSSEQIDLLPTKWEKIGDVLILTLPNKLSKKYSVAQLYAETLNCRAVLEDVGGIKGQMRTPHMRHLWGDRSTVTIHKENGIRYKLDPARIMFSSGNVDERIRMASVGHANDIIVDLFAGIGYFTLPLAIYCQATVHACEINPVAHHYLQENCQLNRVTQRVYTHQGNCWEVAPRNCASRVIMGFLHSEPYLPLALDLLQSTGGIIHYHTTCPAETFPLTPMTSIRSAAANQGRDVHLLKARIVKSYAPGIVHGVLDIAVSS